MARLMLLNADALAVWVKKAGERGVFHDAATASGFKLALAVFKQVTDDEKRRALDILGVGRRAVTVGGYFVHRANIQIFCDAQVSGRHRLGDNSILAGISYP